VAFALTALLVAAVAQSASAASPGKPGPIAYAKSSSDEVGEGTVETLGGLFAHGPMRRDRPRQLTTDPDDNSPSYSADGHRIVFASDDGAGGSAIYVMSSDGAGRQLVIADGTYPAFVARDVVVFVRRAEGHSHLFIVRLDGSGLRQLTSGPFNDFDPAVSPNGKRIAFSSNRDPDGRRDHSDVFSIGTDGTGLRVLVDGPRSEYEPDFAPNGRHVAFVSNRGHGIGIWVARTGGSGSRRITGCKPFPARCRTYASPAFSPDGKHIAVLGLGTRTSTISIIRADGGGVSTEVDSGGTEEEGFGSHVGPPTWGPADPGRRISASSVARVQSTPRSPRP
jgi:Tol biopolymer transport system component